MWESAPVSEVEKLPFGIDGLVRYTIAKAKTSKQISAALLTDGRRRKKSNVTQWKQYRGMRYADCRGSFKCINGQCPFRVQFGVTNTKQFKNRFKQPRSLFNMWRCRSICNLPCEARQKKCTGVSLWEPLLPHNIDA